jgi:hypothetical protein
MSDDPHLPHVHEGDDPYVCSRCRRPWGAVAHMVGRARLRQCPDCRMNPCQCDDEFPEEPAVPCEHCRQPICRDENHRWHHVHNRARTCGLHRRATPAAGLCSNCGEPEQSPGHRICAECAAAQDEAR